MLPPKPNNRGPKRRKLNPHLPRPSPPRRSKFSSQSTRPPLNFAPQNNFTDKLAEEYARQMNPKQLISQLDEMVAERNEALISLDESKIRAFMTKYDTPIPVDIEEFWTGIHKARVLLVGIMPESAVIESLRWLDAKNIKVRE